MNRLKTTALSHGAFELKFINLCQQRREERSIDAEKSKTPGMRPRNSDNESESSKVNDNYIDPIIETGCELQNDAVLLCYADTKDWRKCKKELEAFKACMKRYENDNVTINSINKKNI